MLHLLETFKVVAESGTLSRAAETLHISQPAVSRQIKALEQELGAVLLSRTPHGVDLTPVGREVLVHAREALAALAACRLVATKGAPGKSEAVLRVAAGNMLMQFLVAPAAAGLKADRPEIAIELHSGSFQDCLDMLTAYAVDLALISTPQIPHGLKARPLFTDPMMLAGPPGSAVASRAEVGLEELRGQTVQVLPKATGLRQQLVRILNEAGVECHLVEQASVETIKTMVALGMGVTMLPRSAVAADVRQGRLSAAPVRDWPDHGRQVLAVTRAEGKLPEPVAAILKRIEAQRHLPRKNG